MKKLLSFLFLSLFLNQFSYSQKMDTAMAKKLLSGVFPNISGKDAGAFAAAVMGKEEYKLGEDSKKNRKVFRKARLPNIICQTVKYTREHNGITGFTFQNSMTLKSLHV